MIKTEKLVKTENTLNVLKILVALIAQVSIPFIIILLLMLYYPDVNEANKWRILAPCSAIMMSWILASTYTISRLGFVTLKHLQFCIPVSLCGLAIFWFITYHTNSFVMLLVFVALAGGSFIITKLLLAFFSGHTKIQGVDPADESNILTQIDNYRLNKISKSDKKLHSEFLQFALEKKRVSTCKRCHKNLFIIDNQMTDLEYCDSCISKK